MPDGKLRVAILGCGNIAGGYDLSSSGDAVLTHAKAFQNNTRVEIVAAHDVDRARGEEFCRRWNVPRFYPELGALLDDCQADIFSICTPNETHFETFKAVAGCKPSAVLCEKPLAMNAADARQMLEIAKSGGIRLAVNYQRRWDVSLGALGDRIRAGEFGKVQLVRALYTKGVFHNASHLINLLQGWMGECRAETVHRVLGRTGDDLLAHFSLEYERCPEASFHAIDSASYNYAELDLHFSRARVFLPGGGSEIQIQWAADAPGIPGMRALSGQRETPGSTTRRAMQEVIDNVVSSVLDGSPLRMSADEAVKTIEICERVRTK